MRPLILAVLCGLLSAPLAGQLSAPSNIRLTTVPAVIPIAPGDDLQAALHAARGGTIIELQPGLYEGTFVLPATDPSDGWKTLRVAGALPAGRVGPEHLDRLWQLVSRTANTSPLRTASGAHHWRLQGCALTQTGGNTYDLLRLGTGSEQLIDLPHHFEVDQCYVFVGDAMSQRRGITVNAADVTIRNSSVVNIKEPGIDSTAIGAWNTPGPVHIENTLMEAAGENSLWGGADPVIPGLVTTGITMIGNTFRKPVSWRGGPWLVKNLLEFKNARQVVVRGNVFEYNWVHGQPGFAILFTPRNQGGRAPWARVEDVRFEDNVIRHSASGINILGTDDERPSGRTARIVVRHNLLLLSRREWGGPGSGICFLIVDGPVDVTLDHNTCMADGNFVAVGGEPSPGFRMTNNLARHNAYGIVGDSTAIGTPTILKWFPGATIQANVIAGRPENYAYPAGTLLPSLAEFLAHFVDPASGDYTLVPGSPWRTAATDGTALGVDHRRLPAFD